MGILFLCLIALLVLVIVPLQMEFLDVPIIPRTNHLLTFLTAPLTNAQKTMDHHPAADHFLYR